MNALNTENKFLLFVIALLLICQCQSYSRETDKEFAAHIADSDKILAGPDGLHPSYAYMKNGKIRGIEFIAHPECGEYTKKYVFSDQEKIEKVFIHKNFFNSSCGETFDSLYIVDFTKNKVFASAGFFKEKEIGNSMVKEESIEVDGYRKEIRTWKIK